eukprot:1145811-Pelagomonas_calceolata.AAC.2
MPKEEAPTWQWHRLLIELRPCRWRRLLPGSGTASYQSLLKEEAPTWQWHRLLSEPAQRGGSCLVVAPPPNRAEALPMEEAPTWQWRLPAGALSECAAAGECKNKRMQEQQRFLTGYCFAEAFK